VRDRAGERESESERKEEQREKEGGRERGMDGGREGEWERERGWARWTSAVKVLPVPGWPWSKKMQPPPLPEIRSEKDVCH